MAIQHTEQFDKFVSDPSTGEILFSASEVKTSTISHPVPEDKFIKIYYDAFLQAVDFEGSSESASLLVAIGKHMSYAGENQIVVLNKVIKNSIATEINKSVRQVERLIRRFCEVGILKRADSPRSATYYVSPFVLAKGKWNQVQKLRLEYTKRDETMQANILNKASEPIPLGGNEESEQINSDPDLVV